MHKQVFEGFLKHSKSLRVGCSYSNLYLSFSQTHSQTHSQYIGLTIVWRKMLLSLRNQGLKITHNSLAFQPYSRPLLPASDLTGLRKGFRANLNGTELSQQACQWYMYLHSQVQGCIAIFSPTVNLHLSSGQKRDQEVSLVLLDRVCPYIVVERCATLGG